MFAEVITIGDELLIGQVIDTNSSWIAKELNLIGIQINRINAVQDRKESIIAALIEAEKRADLVLVTGGLGPTKDDITKDAICTYFETQLLFNSEAYKNIERLFLERNYSVTESNRLQAMLPENCVPIINMEGTASGMWMEKNAAVFIFLPGVPYEMKGLMQRDLIQRIKSRFKTPTIVHKTVLTTGIGESFLAEKIEEWEKSLPENIRLAYLPSPGFVKLRLTAIGTDSEKLWNSINRLIETLSEMISKHIIGYDEDTLEEIIGQMLFSQNATLSLAESCTGGNLGHVVTSVAGSSVYFKGGVIAYSNEIKINVLGVDENQLEVFGAVSKEVAESMAINVKTKFKSTYSIAVTGIAGPLGGSAEKPIGTVWIAVASKEKIVSKRFQLGDNRERNIIKASIAALNLLRLEILESVENNSPKI